MRPAVSNKGNFRSYSGKISKAYQGRSGTVMMHDLVMRTFVGPRPEGMDIDHIDRNKRNNRRTNLRYVTRRENLANRVMDHSLAAKARGKPVLATKDGVTTWYESNSAAARALGLKQGSIAYNADHGKSHGGYLFGREAVEEVEGEDWVELTDEMLAQAKRPAL